jgi:aminopeptidase YwaD
MSGGCVRFERTKWVICSTLLLMTVSAAVAQSTSHWTVKPQWIRAHEEFLASDAMQGRGSATHDEEVTATYVASEFLGYGLKTAPGMTGYIQRAAVVQPMLDGHATIAAGSATLLEESDFHLIVASGRPAYGPLLHVEAKDAAQTKVARGAVVLLEHVPADKPAMQMARPLFRAGAAVVLVQEDASTQKYLTMLGGRPRISMRLEDGPSEHHAATLAALTPTAMARLAALKEGETVSLTVHEVPQAAPRFTYNAIGYLPGSDPKAGTILLSAHLDHLGMRPPVNGDGIYNGANDDASGTTAVLELAHALSSGPRLRRSVLFVCYGSEEAGELGSTYFGEHPPVPLKKLVANLEFEMIGNQDPKMPKGVLMLTGWERSNLGPALKAHGALLGPDPYPEQHFFERSDNYALALEGVVAHTAAGWGTVPTYHQADDDLQHLDLPFLTAAIQSLVVPVRWLANSGFVPKWNAGGQPKAAE